MEVKEKYFCVFYYLKIGDGDFFQRTVKQTFNVRTSPREMNHSNFPFCTGRYNYRLYFFHTLAKTVNTNH